MLDVSILTDLPDILSSLTSISQPSIIFNIDCCTALPLTSLLSPLASLAFILSNSSKNTIPFWVFSISLSAAIYKSFIISSKSLPTYPEAVNELASCIVYGKSKQLHNALIVSDFPVVCY